MTYDRAIGMYCIIFVALGTCQRCLTGCLQYDGAISRVCGSHCYHL